MPRHLIDGVRAVRRDLDQVFLPDVLAVGLPVHNTVHELDTHAQLLSDGVQRRGRALVFCDDVPAVGMKTMEIMVEVGASALVIEAGRTLLVEKDKVIALAEAHDITIVAME